MLISDRRKFIFIHIYKVAGTSIRTALYPYSQPYRFLLTKILRRLSVHRIVRHWSLMQFPWHTTVMTWNPP